MFHRRLLIALAGWALTTASAWAGDHAYEREPIRYSATPTRDAVARLQEQIEAGEVSLPFDDKLGYLPAVLERLQAPVSSQGFVFSKTSFQRSRIGPKNPRAVYFGDDAYVGFVPGGDVLELTAVDAQQGAIFYSLSNHPSERPQFQRQTDKCLVCHATRNTMDVPGHVVRSVFPDLRGEPHFGAGSFHTTHESPLGERWGGWYVTGTHGGQKHLGNVCFPDRETARDAALLTGGNVHDLSTYFDTAAYLSPHSDLVALMVLEHQTHAHNLLAWANYETRAALWYNRMLNQSFEQADDSLSESTERRLNAAAQKLVDGLLFVHEAPLAEPVRGTSSFVEEFAAAGPRDAQGRSLREFDLHTRLFKYPCSYLVNSPTFDGLPEAIKSRVYRRLWERLQPSAAEEKGAPAVPERGAILDILRATKDDLPDYWRS